MFWQGRVADVLLRKFFLQKEDSPASPVTYGGQGCAGVLVLGWA